MKRSGITRKHITVAVPADLYRQTRTLAAQYDTTVTDFVAYLLRVMPEALKAARYPGGPPRFSLIRAPLCHVCPFAPTTPAAAPGVAPSPAPTPSASAPSPAAALAAPAPAAPAPQSSPAPASPPPGAK